MMGFFVVMLDLWLLGLAFWGVAGVIASVVLAVVHRRRRRRWQRIAAIVCGVVGGLCLLTLAALFIFAALDR